MPLSAPVTNPTLSVFFTNQGLVHNETGELDLVDGGDSTGTFEGDPYDPLADNFTPEAGSSVDADTVEFAGGDDTVAGSYTVVSLTSVSNTLLTFTSTSNVGLDRQLPQLGNSTVDLMRRTRPARWTSATWMWKTAAHSPRTPTSRSPGSSTPSEVRSTVLVLTTNGTSYFRAVGGPTTDQRGICYTLVRYARPGSGWFGHQSGRATFEMQELTTILGSGTFTNDGTLLVDHLPYDYEGISTFDVFLDNAGTVHIATDELDLLSERRHEQRHDSGRPRHSHRISWRPLHVRARLRADCRHPGSFLG